MEQFFTPRTSDIMSKCCNSRHEIDCQTLTSLGSMEQFGSFLIHQLADCLYLRVMRHPDRMAITAEVMCDICSYKQHCKL